jgi:TonB family protein
MITTPPRPKTGDLLREQARVSFRRNLVWVALAHAFVIGLFGIWSFWHPQEKPIETIQLISVGKPPKGHSLETKSTHAAALQAPPPAMKGSEAPPAPPVRQPQVVTPPQPEVQQAAEPVPVESPAELPPVQTDIPLKIEKPKPPVKAATHKPTKPAPVLEESTDPVKTTAPSRPKIKVDLTKTVVRSSTGSPGHGAAENRGSSSKPSASHSQAEGEGQDEVSSSDIASKLGGALQRAGVADGTGSGSAGSNGSAQRGEYLGLITREILANWHDREQWIATRVRPKIAITVAKDGTISNVTLKESSGNPDLDQSVMAAIHQTGHFSEAPPANLESTFTVTVK